MEGEKMSLEHSPDNQTRLNWRVAEFCDAFKMGRTKFYGLVSSGKLRIVKCGNTSLITEAERLRFQQAMEEGEV